MNQKPALGKGLASLLPGAAFPPSPSPEKPAQQPNAASFFAHEDTTKDRHHAIALMDVHAIKENPYQPRREFEATALEEMAQSIRSNGIIQPLIVRREGNSYQLIAGERRLRAAKLVGLKQVPVVIRKSTDRESLELAIIENIQRQELNCVDEALGYQRLTNEFFLTQEEIAKKVGKERSTVANLLRLLQLPEVILDDLKVGRLSLGHAKVLLSVEDFETRVRLRNETTGKKLSVRELEALVEQIKAKKENLGRSGAENSENDPSTTHAELRLRLRKLSEDLARFWSTKVQVQGSETHGKIILHYSSRVELDRLLGSMQEK